MEQQARQQRKTETGKTDFCFEITTSSSKNVTLADYKGFVVSSGLFSE
jgi:hypothetical protein